MRLTSSSDEGLRSVTETTGGATTELELSCLSVGMVTTLLVTACGAWICSTWLGWDSTIGRPEQETQHTNYRSQLYYNHIFTVCFTLMNTVSMWSHSTFDLPSTTKIFRLQAGSYIGLLQMVHCSSPSPSWPLVTCANPLSLTGLCVFKVQVERCLSSQPVVLNIHIPKGEVCVFYVH